MEDGNLADKLSFQDFVFTVEIFKIKKCGASYELPSNI